MVSNKSVILVDNEEFILELCRTYLAYSRPHLRVITCKSTKEAMAALEKEHFDLLITDLQRETPACGRLLIADVRKLYPNTRIIVATGDRLTEAQVSCLGANAYLAKPYDCATLLENVNALLEPDVPRKRGGSALGANPVIEKPYDCSVRLASVDALLKPAVPRKQSARCKAVFVGRFSRYHRLWPEMIKQSHFPQLNYKHCKTVRDALQERAGVYIVDVGSIGPTSSMCGLYGGIEALHDMHPGAEIVLSSVVFGRTCVEWLVDDIQSATGIRLATVIAGWSSRQNMEKTARFLMQHEKSSDV
jgi:DNA-binding response OmpR family regulator